MHHGRRHGVDAVGVGPDTARVDAAGASALARVVDVMSGQGMFRTSLPDWPYSSSPTSPAGPPVRLSLPAPPWTMSVPVPAVHHVVAAVAGQDVVAGPAVDDVVAAAAADVVVAAAAVEDVGHSGMPISVSAKPEPVAFSKPARTSLSA